MSSPFPGIDPYLEARVRWPGFHNALITHCGEALNAALPEAYVALIDEQVHLVGAEGGPAAMIRPDLAVVREDGPRSAPSGKAGAATLEPVTGALATADPEEVRETWIEVRRLPDERLVAVIELLSPTNKMGVGRLEYLDKREALIDRPVHLVEIDLLLGGRRLPMKGPLPPGDCFAIVARAESRPGCDIYAWSIRQPLPTIPIPLLPPDPDVPLDLATVFATAYDRGRYARILDYGAPLGLPLAPEDLAWVEQTARAARR